MTKHPSFKGVPATVHGYPIVLAQTTQASAMTRAGHVILVDRGAETLPDCRWVTAWLGRGDASWWRGGYFHNYRDAFADYTRRCERGW